MSINFVSKKGYGLAWQEAGGYEFGWIQKLIYLNK